MGLIKATQRDIERFLGKVDKLPNGCWYWNGARSKGRGKKWYGSFHIANRTVRAHRFSSEVFNEDECPPDHHRDHLCCFSMCVAPEHIEVVPQEINQARRAGSPPPPLPDHHWLPFAGDFRQWEPWIRNTLKTRPDYVECSLGAGGGDVVAYVEQDGRTGVGRNYHPDWDEIEFFRLHFSHRYYNPAR